jgi:phosphohistidine phosphatase
MSLTLVLIRHAESSRSDATLDDFDRPLNGRGRQSAAAVGTWLAERGHTPGDVIVSGARRTVDTWAEMAMKLEGAGDMRSNLALYDCASDTVLAVLRGAKAPTSMLIAHNPAIANFAHRIVSAPSGHPGFQDFPTCATAVITFDAPDWNAADWSQGTVIDFVVPRDLIDED